MEHARLDNRWLREISLFSDLSGVEAEEVSTLFEPFSLDPGETLFRHGEAADRFFIVDRGDSRSLLARRATAAST